MGEVGGMSPSCYCCFLSLTLTVVLDACRGHVLLPSRDSALSIAACESTKVERRE
jgi:hypothetical protein